MKNDQAGLLEEYKTLREEIMRRQDARILILGFTVTGIGTVIGVILGNNPGAVQGLDYYALALVSFALVMLITALLITINHTQQIDVISAYIIKYIESKVDSIQWETRWNRYRISRRSNPKAKGLPLGASMPLAFYYGFLTVAVYSISFVKGLYNYWLVFLIVSSMTMVSLFYSFDLYKRITKGWKINWDIADSNKK
jgi:hypothetical protein